MWQGNEGNTFQATSGTLTEERKNGYSDNIRLIYEAQSDNEEIAAAATEMLVANNMGLVKSIAAKFRDRGVDMEDLVQIGSIGVIKAIRSFDVERGTVFSTYAVPLIFGEIRRHLRDEGPIKVGRQYKRLGAMLMNFKNRILAEEGREAKISELAELCGVEVEEAAMALDAASPLISLSDSAYGEDDADAIELGSTIADEESSTEIERLCDKIAINEAISKMPELWQKIVLFRFYRNKTQQQTANILGLTQVKISREEKKILDFLREKLTV